MKSSVMVGLFVYGMGQGTHLFLDEKSLIIPQGYINMVRAGIWERCAERLRAYFMLRIAT